MIPAIALDLDKTVYTNSPAMEAAENSALYDRIIPFNETKKMFGLTNFPEEQEIAMKKGFWGEWEKLAIKDIEPNEEMIKFLQRLQGSGISLNAMTARSARIQEPTMRLLEKMGIFPNEVFFRPDTVAGEDMSAATMKVNWMKQTANKYNYVAMFDDSKSNVEAALKYGVPTILQPSDKSSKVDPEFLEGAISRGRSKMEEFAAKGLITPKQMKKGIYNTRALLDIAIGGSASSQRTFSGISEAKSLAKLIMRI